MGYRRNSKETSTQRVSLSSAVKKKTAWQPPKTETAERGARWGKGAAKCRKENSRERKNHQRKIIGDRKPSPKGRIPDNN